MPTTQHPPPFAADPDETASIRTLLRRLGSDTGELVQAEIQLAKLEVRELARQAMLDGLKIGVALALAFVGALTLVAWAVLALGDVLGGHHGTAALILGGLMLLVGALLALAGKKGLERAGPPEQTIDSLRQDGAMARRELRSLKEQLTGSGESDRGAARLGTTAQPEAAAARLHAPSATERT